MLKDIHVLGKSDSITVTSLRRRLELYGLDISLVAEAQPDWDWDQVGFVHRDGLDVAKLERHLVSASSTAKDWIAHFADGLNRLSPRSAVAWLRSFIPRVTVMYVIRVLPGVDRAPGWECVENIQEMLVCAEGGISIIDGEGIANIAGHIVVEFADDQHGWCPTAVIRPNGTWAQFCIDLADAAHREAFLAGRIPRGVKVLGTLRL